MACVVRWVYMCVFVCCGFGVVTGGRACGVDGVGRAFGVGGFSHDM